MHSIDNKQLIDECLCSGFIGQRFSPGEFSSVVLVGFRVEKAKLEAGASWLQDVLFGIQFTPERIGVAASKILADATQAQRDGVSIVGSIMRLINFDRTHSTLTALDVNTLTRVANQVTEWLESEETANIPVDKLKQLLAALVTPSTIR